MSGSLSAGRTVPMDFEAGAVPMQANPFHVQHFFSRVGQMAQRLGAQFPKEQVAVAVEQVIHAGIDNMATTPTLMDVKDHYTLPTTLRAGGVPGLAVNTATGGMQLALAAADQMSSSMGMTRPGEVQQRFATNAHNAVNNAKVGVPQAARNAQDAFSHSWNPFTGMQMRAMAQMKANSQMMASGGVVGQAPVIHHVGTE